MFHSVHSFFSRLFRYLDRLFQYHARKVLAQEQARAWEPVPHVTKPLQPAFENYCSAHNAYRPCPVCRYQKTQPLQSKESNRNHRGYVPGEELLPLLGKQPTKPLALPLMPDTPLPEIDASFLLDKRSDTIFVRKEVTGNLIETENSEPEDRTRDTKNLPVWEIWEYLFESRQVTAQLEQLMRGPTSIQETDKTKSV